MSKKILVTISFFLIVLLTASIYIYLPKYEKRDNGNDLTNHSSDFLINHQDIVKKWKKNIDVSDPLGLNNMPRQPIARDIQPPRPLKYRNLGLQTNQGLNYNQ